MVLSPLVVAWAGTFFYLAICRNEGKQDLGPECIGLPLYKEQSVLSLYPLPLIELES